MTDKQILFDYRLKQAGETLRDAQNMLLGGFSNRSIVNRAYYSMFYAVLALFIKNETEIKTSKHSGVISIFDKEFIHSGRLDKKLSKMLHKAFELRQESDYKELVELPSDEVNELVNQARDY